MNIIIGNGSFDLARQSLLLNNGILKASRKVKIDVKKHKNL